MAAVREAHSNLQSFLQTTTPTVPLYTVPKTSLSDLNSLWKSGEKAVIEYFTLGDVWNHYREWSAYGAAVPVFLTSGQPAVQYFVPYLSSIQIFTNKSLAASRNVAEDIMSNYWTDTSECDTFWDALSDNLNSEQDDSGQRKFGHLYFEYFENKSPHGRMPLSTKVKQLARDCKGLTTLKSVELSPSSWMSVAWYPIYSIPAGGSVKGLFSAAFLTYHSLSSFQDNAIKSKNDNAIEGKNEAIYRASRRVKEEKSDEVKNSISLSAFGVVTHKMRAKLWLDSEAGDPERLQALFRSSQSWLSHMGVEQHDFKFFVSH